MKTSHLIAGMMTFALLAPAVAADRPAPNTLTPQEIADGWILLFDGQTNFGWKVEGDAKVADGLVTVGGEKESLAQTTTEFGDFELRFGYRGKGRLMLNGENHELPPADNANAWTRVECKVESKDDGYSTTLRTMTRGQESSAASAQAGTGKKPSRTTVAFKVAAGDQLTLRSIKLKPLATKSLFNGKDLAGWKPLPGHASTFTVTEKGELNIKNGGGEIQTEGKWADFVLQLDVYSNGKHLNSGIFFRAIPGQFWQGYEAQIRNQWEGDDRTKPVDIGTGGIYNRQPTRKVVPNDKEWFTYTLIADGKHMATWINGYQTADFTDNDKDAETARKGRFLGKGAIGLQGHDPTTDLSFRNIRLAELPEKK